MCVHEIACSSFSARCCTISFPCVANHTKGTLHASVFGYLIKTALSCLALLLFTTHLWSTQSSKFLLPIFAIFFSFWNLSKARFNHQPYNKGVFKMVIFYGLKTAFTVLYLAFVVFSSQFMTEFLVFLAFLRFVRSPCSTGNSCRTFGQPIVCGQFSRAFKASS